MIKKILAVLCVVLIAFNCIALSVFATDVEAVVSSAEEVWSALKSFASTTTEFGHCLERMPLEAFDYYFDGTWLYLDKNSDIGYAIGGGGGLVRNGAGGGGGINRTVTSADDLIVSGETFSDICDRLASQYAPDAKKEYISWKTDTYNRTVKPLDMITVYQNGEICGFTDEAYMLPFATDGSNYWYAMALLHVVREVSDSGGISYKFNVLSTVDDNETEYVYKNGIENFPYWRVWLDSNRNIAVCDTYYTYSAYISDERDDYWYCFSKPSIEFETLYLSTDLSQTASFYNRMRACSDFDSVDDTDNDWGFIISDEPIAMDGIIQPIPVEHLEDTTVTLAGDTIYDYTITNNTTGDTSTVNYYVNNNYTYENTNDDNDDTSSGGISGDVTVSGDIEVGGKVDININVEQGSGTASDIKGYEYEEVNLGEALEQIPEMSDGFTSWFQQVFAWLPPELMGLLIGGIALAILLRLAGR